MSLDENIVSEIIKDGIKITNYKDGSQHFESIYNPNAQIKVNERNWWQKLKDWWNDAPVAPYIKVRDLADPLEKRLNDPDDKDVGSDGKNNVEVGIKIKF